jgi:hypothetical protein
MLPEPTIGSVESWNLGFETPQGEFECVTETDPGKLLRGCLGDEKASAVKHPAKDGAGVALGSRCVLLSGAEAATRV